MPIRIIFCGTPTFACPSLQALHTDAAFEITHVITQPDKPAGRGKKLTSPPVKLLAQKLGLSVLQPQNINNFFSQMPNAKSQLPDYLVVVAYGQILSKEVLAIPRIAPINVHPSLLPRFRGASPIQHALLAGDKETGVTIQRMVEELDCGPILAQEKVALDPRETRESLERKLALLGASLLVRTLHVMLSPSPKRHGELACPSEAPVERRRVEPRSTSHLETEQDETQATYCKKLTREMGDVDPKKMTAEEIDRKVRALVPWPGIRMSFSSSEAGSTLLDSSRGRGTHSKKTEPAESRSVGIKLIETSLEPHKDAFAIPCTQGSTLYVLKLQPPTKRVMTGVEWGRGQH